MFSHLTSELRGEVETVQQALVISDGLRNLLIVRHAALSGLPAEVPAGADDITTTAHELKRLLPGTPDKLDWQIYDHCAALTRLYAIYERFVGELMTEYVRLLPKLYPRYADLPASVATQHRVGIGQILLKMGDKGPYKNLEEQVVVRELAAGLSGSSEYTLLADAFFIERQNLRFGMLCRLFSALGFRHCGRYINRHHAVTNFIKAERADSSSAEKELQYFIEYRNEAAHRKVENVLAIDAIAVIGRFLVALGHALADMVEEGVLQRRMELKHYSLVTKVSETHYDGHVVIGTPGVGVRIEVGDKIVIVGKKVCHSARVESLQLNGQSVEATNGDGATEVGLRLSKGSPEGAELRRVQAPPQAPVEVQLRLDDAMPPMVDTADTDVADVVEPLSTDVAGASDQAEAE